jgi:hypothetical protein
MGLRHGCNYCLNLFMRACIFQTRVTSTFYASYIDDSEPRKQRKKKYFRTRFFMFVSYWQLNKVQMNLFDYLHHCYQLYPA